MCVFIAKTRDGFLYPLNGDVYWTDKQEEAGYFLTREEAVSTAQGLGYSYGSYELISVDVEKNKLIRQ